MVVLKHLNILKFTYYNIHNSISFKNIQEKDLKTQLTRFKIIPYRIPCQAFILLNIIASSILFIIEYRIMVNGDINYVNEVFFIVKHQL